MGDHGLMSGIIRRVREREVYANAYVVVHDDDVVLGDATAGRYVRIQTAGGAGAALVVVHDGQVALVSVYRYPIGRWQWGLPRGFAVSDDPLDTARTELREELGITDPLSLTVLGSFTPDSGIQSSTVWVVRADVAHAGTEPQDTAEVSDVRWVDVDALDEMIRRGELDDGISLAALAVAARHPGNRRDDPSARGQ